MKLLYQLEFRIPISATVLHLPPPPLDFCFHFQFSIAARSLDSYHRLRPPLTAAAVGLLQPVGFRWIFHSSELLKLEREISDSSEFPFHGALALGKAKLRLLQWQQSSSSCAVNHDAGVVGAISGSGCVARRLHPSHAPPSPPRRYVKSRFLKTPKICQFPWPFTVTFSGNSGEFFRWRFKHLSQRRTSALIAPPPTELSSPTAQIPMVFPAMVSSQKKTDANFQKSQPAPRRFGISFTGSINPDIASSLRICSKQIPSDQVLSFTVIQLADHRDFRRNSMWCPTPSL
ncbi:hypothetical protein BUALT_Bualt07G0106600 [Buddleja alternifolia]|uniref:Uncharacterized protein n=1 Tax=Buddleja alternifolia TaxID=168488 RepID=A0AAV6XHI6_9LAMI|nr:hypothetical protein BUALT_Bualt07G0106600 [Buddleja alternifolia]